MIPIAWSPSSARTILLADQAMPAPNGRIAAILPLRWPPKGAAETLDYGLDATSLMASATDTLTATLNATTNLSAVASPIVIGGLVVLWLTGGTSGSDGLVDVTLTTQAGAVARRIIRTLIL